MDPMVNEWSWRDINLPIATCSIVEAPVELGRGFIRGLKVVINDISLLGRNTQIYSTKIISPIFLSKNNLYNLPVANRRW
jgi:UDP-3-O-[3-hydroxymyristoyl] glucosamine N-acyltransferase